MKNFFSYKVPPLLFWNHYTQSNKITELRILQGWNHSEESRDILYAVAML